LKYNLIKGSLNDTTKPVETILRNRGIVDYKAYMNLDSSACHSYELLNNIDEAVDCLLEHLKKMHEIHILVDCDVDGYTSAAIMYMYIKKIKPDIGIRYYLHTGKQHGLSPDIVLDDNIDLLIIPDAGSNDIDQCKTLKEKGTDIIILDHHVCDEHNPYAIVVNNQMGNYPNKDLCGVGIVYKFLQALDDELWENYADDFLDLVALGNISDNMDIRSFETRALINAGLSKIRNKLFKEIIKKQEYSMKDIINPINVQFYVTPTINACVRIGTEEEKDLMFRAFTEQDETFKYTKRGSDEEIDESIYERVARLCSNARNRQSNMVKKCLPEVDEQIVRNKMQDDKVLFINATNIIGDTLTGLVAIKVAEKYNRPCVMLRRRSDDGEYGGSCRNIDYSPLESLKEFLESLGTFEFVSGHPNAAGVSIKRGNVQASINKCNKLLKDVSFEHCYQVDFDIDYADLDIAFIKAVDEMKDIFGEKLDTPLVLIRNIPVTRGNTMLMGKAKTSWKIIDDDGFAIVKTNSEDADDVLVNALFEFAEVDVDFDFATMHVVGELEVNNYKGILTPQVKVKDFVLSKWEEVDEQFIT